MAWASAAPQQMRISAIEPDKAAMFIGLNQSTMQLGIAAGAGLGGIIINAWPATTLPLIGAAAGRGIRPGGVIPSPCVHPLG